MPPLVLLPAPAILVAGTAIMLASGLAGTVAILDLDVRLRLRRRRPFPVVERERDVATALGIPWPRWVILRCAAMLAAIIAGAVSGVWAVAVLLVAIATFGLRFALAGRAASRRLRMERAFLAQLRTLRDRMAVGNQSLDTALQELGLNPGAELEHVLAPLADGGSIVANVVVCAQRARSPIVEQALGVLIWARSRNLDALIDAIDEVLLPVGDAQLAVQEESLVTLSQQRAVTFAMAALMTVMFVAVIRVDSFRAYYQTSAGILVLAAASACFFGLIGLLNRILDTPSWTRWDVKHIADLEAAPHA